MIDSSGLDLDRIIGRETGGEPWWTKRTFHEPNFHDTHVSFFVFWARINRAAEVNPWESIIYWIEETTPSISFRPDGKWTLQNDQAIIEMETYIYIHITILLSSFKIQFIGYDTFYEFYPSPTDGQPMTDRSKMSRKNTRYSPVIEKNGFHILPYR